ncbi:MAG TPA: HIT domain-containing protein [Caulobacteraceae bacterium]|jgi:diadenosine tetraphosphate (Ap4A) HIT family hydrolase
MFEVDPAFAAGSRPVASLGLCEARLQLDARYPWLILIPRIESARELEDLSAQARSRLLDELVLAGAAVRAIGEAMGRPVAKLNVGLLGNVTPQLHAHVVGRRPDDAAWPGPVWGQGEAVAYGPHDLERAMAAVLEVLLSDARG